MGKSSERPTSSSSESGPAPPRRTARPPGAGARGLEVGVTTGAAAPRARKATSLSPTGERRSARGPVLVSIDAEVERRTGEEGRERVVALLPDAHAEELRTGRPSVLDAHDIEVVRVYADIASRVLGLDLATFQDMGRQAVDRELAPFVKTLVLPGRLPDVVRRSIDIVGRFCQFGAWSIRRSSLNLVAIHVDQFELASPLLRAWYLGVLEGILRHSTSPDAHVVDVTPGSEGASVFEIEASLP